MTLYRLDASIRTEGSVTRAVADTVQKAWSAEHPGASILRRDLGLYPLPADAWRNSVLGGFVPAEDRTAAQRDAAALATVIADELLAADAYLLAIPLYNYAVPHHVKAWFDLLLTDPRFPSGNARLLEGRPAVIVTARGGGYGTGTPREGWDHNTPYLRRMFADILHLDVHFAEAELTLAGVNPAMEALRGLAAQSLADAHATAESHGRTIASRVPSLAA
ncbi:FMN-dependent NADH-azoreductase [Catenuloplanes atrovinosus]|uniref:FMN dependent NADH:quinone oxidoreductase n=1 Tax=Catenuloplanes atrovinosus TaxID=137266 RepID=A0AAE3YM80_9ACTN|nr:NAD(P)H-dependent oxidoreductase [Catenuloplanes atrovinosus]MDR7274773.1 FMN-dependent NADH-azoreductase [Catenuloplanes atrovinosus]